MNRFQYSTGEDVRAGDRLTFQGRSARVLFVKQADGASDFDLGESADEWDFVPAPSAHLVFDDGGECDYDSFCHHDQLTLLARRESSD